jgi:DNA-binding NtrC family response regulator
MMSVMSGGGVGMRGKTGASTILLVEDEQVVLNLLKASLERLGYRVLAAADGDEALSVYQRYRDEVGVVVTDMVMPRMNGEQLIKALRTANPKIRVAVITGYPLSGEARDLLVKGNIRWLQKPVRMVEVAELVQRSLQNNAKSGSAEPEPRSASTREQPTSRRATAGKTAELKRR